MNRSKTIALAALMLLPTAASAHDFWIATTKYRLPAAGTARIEFKIGDEAKPEPWKLKPEKVVALRTHSPQAMTDQQAMIVPMVDKTPGYADLVLTEPGTTLVAFESTQSMSDLPASRFNPYVAHEALTLVAAERARTGSTGKPGRETYSRRAKALFQIGDSPTDQVLKPVGHTLEIVPEINPYALGADRRLPVRVFYRGKPLPGAQVSLLDQRGNGTPAADVVTDSEGRAAFEVPAKSAWRLNVVWSTPVEGNPKAQFDTVFASLTFGYD